MQDYQFHEEIALEPQENIPFFVYFMLMDEANIELILVGDLVEEFVCFLALPQLPQVRFKPPEIRLNREILTPLDAQAVL